MSTSCCSLLLLNENVLRNRNNGDAYDEFGYKLVMIVIMIMLTLVISTKIIITKMM